MHVHLPKPLHGWREFAGEVSIIVLGVLIALGLEQVVQRVEWNHKVEAAEDAMQAELFSDDAPEMIQRAATQPCIDAQLDAIRGAVEAGRPRAELVGLVDRLYLPFVTYDSVAHQNATASDVSTHMPRDRVGLWTQAYGMMPNIDAASTAETIDVAKIRALKRTGGALSSEEQVILLQGVEAVRADGTRMLAGIDWSLSVLPMLHGTIDRKRLEGFMKGARLHYGTCIRDLPADWPKTQLPQLPPGPPPGLAVTESQRAAANHQAQVVDMSAH